jgi:hypothetical protein
MGCSKHIRARLQRLLDRVLERLGLEGCAKGQTQARNGKHSEDFTAFHQELLRF